MEVNCSNRYYQISQSEIGMKYVIFTVYGYPKHPSQNLKENHIVIPEY